MERGKIVLEQEIKKLENLIKYGHLLPEQMEIYKEQIQDLKETVQYLKDELNHC